MGPYWEGYHLVVERVGKQTLEEDLRLIDALYGRDEIPYGASPITVKAEAIRQLSKDWEFPKALRLGP